MSIQYCNTTDRYIDTDEKLEHFCQDCNEAEAIEQDEFDMNLCRYCLRQNREANAADNRYKSDREER